MGRMKLEMENEEKKDFSTSDLYLASAIALIIEIFPKYKIDGEGRVFFSFSRSAALFEAIAAYSGGTPLNCYEYASKIKRVRGDMLMTKNQLKEQGRPGRSYP